MLPQTVDRERQLQQFEGLILSTSRMYAALVSWEEDDFAQELRVKVWKALPKYDPSRSRLSLERYIFGVIKNRTFDFMRAAQREHGRQQRNGLSFSYIEDLYFGGSDTSPTERCEELFQFVDRDDVYGHIDEGKFVLPATLTDPEVRVLLLLMFEWTKPEIALRLGIGRKEVDAAVTSLKAKLADWKPAQQPNSSRVVALAEAA